MTGRELIIYILSNKLEDKPVIDKDGKILGYVSDTDLAKKMNCGVATIQAHIQLGDFKGYKTNGTFYIPEREVVLVK